jgi:hypothetical protein
MAVIAAVMAARHGEHVHVDGLRAELVHYEDQAAAWASELRSDGDPDAASWAALLERQAKQGQLVADALADGDLVEAMRRVLKLERLRPEFE